jgi:hypothetical protein
MRSEFHLTLLQNLRCTKCLKVEIVVSAKISMPEESVYPLKKSDGEAVCQQFSLLHSNNQQSTIKPKVRRSRFTVEGFDMTSEVCPPTEANTAPWYFADKRTRAVVKAHVVN